jgi:hypothetical protein
MAVEPSQAEALLSSRWYPIPKVRGELTQTLLGARPFLQKTTTKTPKALAVAGT